MKPICLAYLPDPNLTKCYGCSWYLEKGLCKHPMFFRCIEMVRANEPTLSYSSMQTFICPRKFWLGYIAGYEAVEKPLPMRLGGSCSHILDSLHSKEFNTQKPDVREQHWLYLQKEWSLDENGYFPYQVEALLSVMQAYVDQGKHMEKGVTQAKSTWWEEGFPRVVVVVDNLQYETIGWEYKYTQKGEAYTKFTVQDQLSTYFLAHSKVERFTVRTILNPIGTIKLGKGEKIDVYRDRVYQDALARPRHYFNDMSYFRNEYDLKAHKAKIRGIADDILRYIEKGQGDMETFRQVNTPYTCFLQSEAGSPSPCEFLPICEQGIISETLYKRREGKVYQDEETGEVKVG